MIFPNGIRVILFDLDGTLRHNRPPSHQVLFSQAIRAGLEDLPEGRYRATRWAHFYWASSLLLREDLSQFEGDEGGFWNNYVYRQLIAYGTPPSEAERLSPALFQFMAQEYEPEDHIPPEVPETLQALDAAGYTLGVVSNRRDPIEDYLAAIELRDKVQFTLTAGEVDSWKPDPGIFQAALHLADAAASETIYVGDNYYADILGAQRAGIRPVLLDPDSLFPDADCEIIRCIEDLPEILG